MNIKAFDVAIAADWEFDKAFIDIVHRACIRNGLTVLEIWPGNLDESLASLQKEEMKIAFFYDRAAHASPEFSELYYRLESEGTSVLDSPESLKRASDKAEMHYAFIENGLNTPYTVILPAADNEPDLMLREKDLEPVGRPFIVKPASQTGGGIGLVDDVVSAEEVKAIRSTFSQDRYLVQEKIIPLELSGRRFWFRGFYCCGYREIAWWNDITHIYERLTGEDIKRYQLEPMMDIVARIHEVCGLHFFSTEIVLKPGGDFVVVDYVNEICDMRLQSQHADGVPDALVHRFSDELAGYFASCLGRG